MVGGPLVDLGKLAKPANTLIEKIAAAIGAIYEPTHIRRIANAQVDAGKITALGRNEISEIERRGFERFVREEGKKQENIEAISHIAAEQLKPDARPENMDDDWIVHFFEKARIISDREMRQLWATLLAGEASKPGSFSKRTVNLVSTMDKNDAELFALFCRFSWSVAGVHVPVITDHNEDIYKRHGINFDSLQHLDAIGLISFIRTGQDYFLRSYAGSSIRISYFGRSFVLLGLSDFNYGRCSFTLAGKQLASVCASNPLDEFCGWFVVRMFNQGYSPYCPLW
jgi:Protein of unknown function (DUF2806)